MYSCTYFINQYLSNNEIFYLLQFRNNVGEFIQQHKKQIKSNYFNIVLLLYQLAMHVSMSIHA